MADIQVPNRYIPNPRKRSRVWWKYAILRISSRTRVVDGELLKRIAEIYDAFDTTEEAIEYVMKVLKVNLSTARNYIWIAIKLELCEAKRKSKSNR